jgi:V/A-type H+-transporting ATPase subunit I
MLKPLPMRQVSLWLVREDAPAASLALAELGTFCPDLEASAALEAPDMAEKRYREAYLSARSRLDRIGALCEAVPEARVPPVPQPVGAAALDALDARLGELWTEAFAAAEAVRMAEAERARTVQLLGTLATFAGLDVDLGALLKERRFLDVRLGTVPAQNVARLRDALALAGFVLDTFGEEAAATRVVVVGPAGRETQIASLLATAGWHGIDVPSDLRTFPDTARGVLQQRLAERDNEIRTKRAEARERLHGHWQELEAAATTLALARPFAEMVQRALRGRGGLTQLSGWIPKRDEARLTAAVTAAVKRPHLLRIRDPEPGERARVPSVVLQPQLLRGFAQLVHTYGVPRYGEIDPTALFAVSFVLMFGMMFGDLGQGAVLAGAGLLLRGKLASARVLMVSCGVASMVFGVLYGSVFGFEHWLQPVWMSPLADPLRMLAVAVYWGIGFIVVASLVRIHNLWVAHGAEAALTDAGGVAGLVLYLGAVAGLVSVFRGGSFGVVPALAMTIGAAAIFAHAFREHAGPSIERALVAFIETFEALIGFFANTLSFMRVGAFSLNHVALAAAVFAIAGMLDGAGHVAAIVVGNLFIMVLEGAIVAIQALRLEYYEGFSRFFSGDGREVNPLLLRTAPRSQHETKGA